MLPLNRSIPLLISFLVPASALSSASIPPADTSGKYTIRAPGISASFIPYSAAITNLFVPDRNGTLRDIVLGYDNASSYQTEPAKTNYGAIPGRYANRIVNATYELDGIRYYTERNIGNGTMHSGTNGWSYRTWNVSEVCEDSITFTLRDEGNSSMGMPGLVLGRVRYSVAQGEWRVRIEAEAPEHRTPLIATSHPYWNLDAFANPGSDGAVLGHTLSLPFGTRMIGYAPFTNETVVGMPDGSLPVVERFSINDFWSSPKHIGANASDPGWVGNCGPGLAGYDCGWLVDRELDSNRNWVQDLTEDEFEDEFMREPIASLWSEWSGIRWDMFSNQAGMALTSCGFFPEDLFPVKETQGGTGSGNDGFVPPSGCIAVEPQDWISGISFPQWGREREQIWGPGKGVYVNEIVYRFSIQGS